MKFQMAMSILFLASLAFLVADADRCDDYNCLKGTCKTMDTLPFVRCECDQGWSNILNMSFLACGIPDCDFSMHCDRNSKVDTPPKNESGFNFDLFNVCSYSICGGGDCVSSSNNLSYSCKCHPGYVNLFGNSSGVCVANCNLGANCSQLGIDLGPSSSPSPTDNSTASDSSNSAFGASIFVWTIIFWSSILGSILAATLVLPV